jgi:serine/threonine protein kinase
MELRRRLAASGLSSAADASRVVDDSPGAAPAAIRQQLLDRGLLTSFQFDAIAQDQLGSLLIGNYEIFDRLGAGGMGTVYKARHRRMKRVVALKTLTGEAARSPRFTERFQREVETVARLSHPNIVMAYDADEADGVPFLVMEFVDGRDLSHEVLEGGPLSPAAAVDRILQAGRGLAYAHAQGIVHRDIKPGNLLRDVSGIVKVADLGLARLTGPVESGERALTMAGAVLGTIDYIAPEQALDAASTDHHADVYSLGCTLYFLLTGEPVYRAISLMALLLAHREAPIPSLRAIRPDVPAELDDFFRAMVAKSPARRPTMGDVVQRLEALAASGKLSAVAPPMDVEISPTESDVFAPTIAGEGDTGESGSFALGPVEPASSVTSDFTVPLSILVVEPSRVQAAIVKKMLTSAGLPEPALAPSGRAALEAIRARPADVVLAALHLDDMTGPQLAAAMFAESSHAAVGFVLATSATDAEAAGVGETLDPRIVVLHKPFDQQQLEKAVQQAVGRRQTSRS